jgi:hypothetical protein
LNVVELADTVDLGPTGAIRASSSLAIQIAITALVVKWLSHHSSKVIFLVRVQAGVDL